MHRSLGFGYIEMESVEAARQTLQALNLSSSLGHVLIVTFLKRLPPGYGPSPA
jgi:hypothetical protein